MAGHEYIFVLGESLSANGTSFKDCLLFFSSRRIIFKGTNHMQHNYDDFCVYRFGQIINTHSLCIIHRGFTLYKCMQRELKVLSAVTLSERVMKEFVLTVRSISISLWPNKMLVHLHLYAPLKPLNLDFLRAKLCYLSTMTQSPTLFK